MQDKIDRLQELLRAGGRTLVAYSGGGDSVLLAKVAHDVLGDRALAVIADSPSLPRRELAEALSLGRQFGYPVRVVPTREMSNPQYESNPPNRCYYCKAELFEELRRLCELEGWETIVYGENASDQGDFRPGAQAAAEHRVRAPLKEAGLTKPEVRALSARLGLPTADKPQMACLSSRIPYGEPVSAAALAMIETAENHLRDAGFREVRVRHHRNMARIEVAPADLPRLVNDGVRDQVVRALKAAGYLYVTVDLEGYRRGSTNEVLRKTKETV